LKAPTNYSVTSSADSPEKSDGEKHAHLERIEKLLSVKDEQNVILQEQHDYYQDLSTDLKDKVDQFEDMWAEANAAKADAEREAEDLTVQIKKLQEELSTRGRARSTTAVVHDLETQMELDADSAREEMEAQVAQLLEEHTLGPYMENNVSDLQSLWRNIGLPDTEQQRLLEEMIRPVVKLCQNETAKNKQHELELQEELEELRAMMATQSEEFTSALAGKLRSESGEELPLWQSVELLRNEGHSLLRDQLEELKAMILATMPGEKKKIKWRTRWVPDIIDQEVLDGTLRPTKSAFENLTRRKAEVAEMANEAARAITEYTTELREQWDALATPQEERDALLTKAQRGGYNAVHDLEKVCEEAKAKVRLRLRSLRVKLTELWVEVKKSGQEQDKFLADVDECKAIDGIAMVENEITRVQGVINSMKDIIKMIAVRESLSNKIQEFETAAKDPERLKGSSVKLMKEEKERKLFKRKNDRICMELITKIEEWEKEMKMPFMYRGVQYKQVLQVEQSTLKDLGGSVLTKTESSSELKSNSPQVTLSNSTKAAPGTAPRPSTGNPVRRDTARRSSGMDSADRRKQLEEWRANNEEKKANQKASKARATAEQQADDHDDGPAAAKTTPAPSRRLSAGGSALRPPAARKL